MKPENSPTHITKGDVFDDLGLSRSEASALKIKAMLLDAILREIEQCGYTQSQLVEILDEYQPSVSNLTRGKIAKVSLEKLLTYSDRLNIKATITVRTRSGGPRNDRRHSPQSAHSPARGHSGSRPPRRQSATTG